MGHSAGFRDGTTQDGGDGHASQLAEQGASQYIGAFSTACKLSREFWLCRGLRSPEIEM